MQGNSAVTPKALAQWLAELPEFASSSSWGIGGSCLLQHLGLVSECRDLDLVCTEAAYAQLFTALNKQLPRVNVPAHPSYCSHYFARFQHESGLEIDLMAGIAVQYSGKVTTWQFEPTLIHRDEQLPWMSPRQWLELYQLFQRPSSAALLQVYCHSRGITVD